MCQLGFFRRLACRPFDERHKQIKWHRQNGRGVMLARNFPHRLQEAQLQGDRLRGNHRCRLYEFFRSLKLAFGVYDFRAPFPLRLGLAGYRALHAVRQTTSLTSTAVTLIPHGSVCRSMISCSLRFILSRCESSSSSSACPSTLRSVVCEMSEVAFRYFSTRTTAAAGSMTRK